jgi:hypothetical protein
MVEDQKEEEVDFDSRALCPDGACTGVIGADGRCKACGRKGDEEPKPGEPLRLRSEEEADFKAERGDHVSPFLAPSGEGEGRGAFDDQERELCPDGACIGVLDSRGICKVCGKSRSS